MTDLIYLKDSYKKQLKAVVVSVRKKGAATEIVLDKTIFYPQGGGQPSDKGEIVGKNGTAHVKHVRMQLDTVVHECSLEGVIKEGDVVECEIDWSLRYQHMRAHSAGHIVHEAVMATCIGLAPVKGEHGNNPYIEYQGSIPIDKTTVIEATANEIIQKNLPMTTEFVTLEELKERSSFVPAHLPKNKPLRILTIDGYQPIPDGGTQVTKTSETGNISISNIENGDNTVRVHYSVEALKSVEETEQLQDATALISMLVELGQRNAQEILESNTATDLLTLEYLGGKSEFIKMSRQITQIPKESRQQVGVVINEVKRAIEQAIAGKEVVSHQSSDVRHFDVTAPGIRPPLGHLHIVTQAIMEITGIFEKIGFTRVRHPEVDWDYYPFESLNMPQNHPARDEWETFFIETSEVRHQTSDKSKINKFNKIVLTPHTSNGQVREMEKGKLPIRMINIAKCYRRQSDVSHAPMFHQFEGLYVDKNVSIGDLKGVMDYFFKQYYGPDRRSRLRPFHFQFTEPSFEVDINCGICLGKGCKLCKEGWLELGGAGMVHPVVLKNGGVDPDVYNGFAFGWGVERVCMMKSGTKLEDIRILYGNDVRFLEQF